MNWTYIVLLIYLLLAAFAIWREVRRDSKRYLLWRIVAVVISIAALACIILPVSYERDITIGDKNTAVLLTEGYDPDSIIAYPATRIYTTDKKIKKQIAKSILISRPADIFDVKPAAGVLDILGYGLSAEELNQLHNLPVKFHPAKIASGISSVSWKQQLKTGEKLMVQGTFNNTSPQSVSLILKGLGTFLDSVVVPKKSINTFNLTGTPRHSGRAAYRLIAVSNSDTLANESIPIEVSAVKPLKVLILAGAPNFENKFLKDWLATNGYGVAMRSMISKDKYSQEFANVPQESLGKLSNSLLGKFDVVVSDMDVLKTLNAAETGALKQQILQSGTGIIVRADSTTHSAFWLQRSFPVNKVSTNTQVITALKIQGQSAPSSKLLIDPVYINYQGYTQPLVTDQQDHLIVSSILAGSGKEVFTTLSNTHSWMLSGNEKDYTAFWSLLITKAAKHTPVAEQWSSVTAVPVINGHSKIQLETSVPNPQIKINQTGVAAVQQPDLPFAYIADYWPAHFGWQQLQQGTGTAQWLYIYPEGEWKTLKYNKMLSDTRAYAAKFATDASVTKQIHQKVQIAVSKIYFYILLLAACTYLWAEAKFSA